MGIIFATYDEVRSEVVGSGTEIETLWSQTYEIYRRGKQTRAKQRVNLTHIEASIRSRRGDAKAPMLREKESLEESKETVSFSELLAMVPGLEMGQAQRLAKNSSRFALGVSSLSLDERAAGGQASSLAASPANAEGQKSTETPQKDRAGKKDSKSDPLGEHSSPEGRRSSVTKASEVLSPLPGGESPGGESSVPQDWTPSRLGRLERRSSRLERLDKLLDDKRLDRLERLLAAVAASESAGSRITDFDSPIKATPARSAVPSRWLGTCVDQSEVGKDVLTI